MKAQANNIRLREIMASKPESSLRKIDVAHIGPKHSSLEIQTKRSEGKHKRKPNKLLKRSFER